MSLANKSGNRNPVIKCGPGVTKQSMEAECNINNIMARYEKTGELTHVREKLGEFRDVSAIPDLHSCMNIVADARSAFMELPVEIRAACRHDVGNFLPWLDDPENRDMADEYGLFKEAKPVPTERGAPKTTPKSVVEKGGKPPQDQMDLDTSGTTDTKSVET